MPKESHKKYPPLSKGTVADVAIIGGGLAGVFSAYCLSKTGKRAVILEAETVGSGATSKTTAFLTQVIDTSLSDLVKMFGSKKAYLVWESHGKAIRTIEHVVEEEKIECSLVRCPSYYYANTKRQFRQLEQEYQTAKKLGIRMTLHRNAGLPFANEGYLEIPNQGKFDAGAFLEGLAKAAVKAGTHIFEQTPVKYIRQKEGAVWEIYTNKQTVVTATDIIIATYYPFSNPKPLLFKKGMYTSYVLELQIPEGTLPEAIYEDTANPYHYFRVDAGNGYDTVLLGGADHRVEIKMDPKKNYRAIEEYAKKIFPSLDYKIISRWTGPILEPTDGLALIGQIGPHQYVATAFSGNGMTYSGIAAALLTHLIAGKSSPYKQIYDPCRIPTFKHLFKRGWDYSEELMKGALKNIFK